MTTPTPSTPASKNDQSVWSALGLAWELGYLIAIPAVVFGIGGAYLDKVLGSSPLLLIGGFALALFISTLTVIRKVRQISK